MSERTAFARFIDHTLFLDTPRKTAKRLASTNAPALAREALRKVDVANELASTSATRDTAWPLYRDAVRVARDARIEAGLSAEDVALAASLPEDAPEARRACADASRLVYALLEGIEPRTLRALNWEARLRQCVVFAAVLVTVQLLTMWIVAPKNLARGKAVSSSLSDESGKLALVNGIIEEHTAPQTIHELDPMVVVDLGAAHTVKKIVVYGRGDRESAEFLPLVVEASVDGVSYVEVGRKKDLFTAYVPWTIKRTLDGVRYIRLTTPKTGRIALSELEVYGY